MIWRSVGAGLNWSRTAAVHWGDQVLLHLPCYTRYDILNPSDWPSPVLSPSRSFLGEPEFRLPPAQHDRVQRTPAYPSRRPLLPIRSSLLPLSHPLHRQLPLGLRQPPGGAVRLQEDRLRPPYSAPKGCGHQMLVSRQRERPSLHLPGGLFELRAGDEIFISVSSPTAVYAEDSSSYFGAFLFDIWETQLGLVVSF